MGSWTGSRATKTDTGFVAGETDFTKGIVGLFVGADVLTATSEGSLFKTGLDLTAGLDFTAAGAGLITGSAFTMASRGVILGGAEETMGEPCLASTGGEPCLTNRVGELCLTNRVGEPCLASRGGEPCLTSGGGRGGSDVVLPALVLQQEVFLQHLPA